MVLIMNKKLEPASPKMNRAQARAFWAALTPEQKRDFMKMMKELEAGNLQLKHVGVDDNEQIQRIVLEKKEKKR